MTEHAWCLTVLTNAVVTWTTEYYTLAVARLQSQGRDIPDYVLTHISPAHSQNVNDYHYSRFVYMAATSGLGWMWPGKAPLRRVESARKS